MGRQRKIEMTWRCRACGTRNLGRHKVCESCGDPKDPTEKFEMPGDPAAAATVTDPELLRRAVAGRDWKCAHCGANVSALEVACTQCGAAREDAANVAPPPLPDPPARAPVLLTVGGLVALVFGLLVVCGGGALVASYVANRPVDVVVAAVAWEHHVHVERYAVRDREGFAEHRPPDAFDVRSLGQRHHHDEQVLDHYETEYYTEQVQDGTTQESYTEQVACGEDCTYEAPSCTETCTDDGNGFATCTETCSGGGQSCTTRYCSEVRWRDVPRYVTVQRSREVPRYRSEPRYAEAFAWKVWDWAPQRTVTARGDTTDVAWPDPSEVALGVGLAPGEQERERREARYHVVFRDDDGREFPWDAPDPDTFRRMAVGSAHRLAWRDDVLVVDPPDE